jgi:hypothetical protein
MEATALLARIETSLGDPKGLWAAKEYPQPLTILDKLMNYLIGHSCDGTVARKSIRHFKGIDSMECIAFSSWNEVRVSSLNDIRDVLQLAGAECDTWELSATIKDFLQNMFDIIGYCELDDDLSEKDVNIYLDQLQGKPNSGEKSAITPYRPTHSWSRKNVRVAGEGILPEPVLMYLKYLLGKTRYAPFDYHSEKVLTRLGLMAKTTEYQTKKNIYNDLLGTDKPVSRHRKLVEFSKIVCLERQPRCVVCPVNADCHFNQKK